MNALVRAPVSGEILGPADVITVTAAVHPLKPHAEILILPAGLSLSEIVEEVARRCHVSRLARGADVSVSGHAVDQALWQRVRVKSGAHVTVRARAGKAIGGILKSVLMIALSVAASFIVGPAGLGIAAAIGGTAGQVVASLAAGAIMMVGGLAINALFPPTQTRSEDNNPSYSISAGRNGASKWGPIPVVLGKIRALPKYAALPYTEFEGDDQYLRLLFVWGYGPMKIEDIRIGDTSIAEFEGVEIETFEGYGDDPEQTIYPSEVVQDDLSIDPAHNVPVTRTSADEADEVVLDFVAPAGLCHVNKKGKREGKNVDFKIEMSVAGANNWVGKGNVRLSGATNDPVRRSFRYRVAKGRYDIRVTRLSPDENTTRDFSDVTWTAIKSFRVDNPPITFGKPLAITALRIKASKQLNGVVDTLNALVTSVGKSWNGSTWLDAKETRNPGDLMRLVLQGPANARAVPDSRLDLSGLAAFADHCSAKGYTFDMYRDFTASVRDTLRDIAAAGRGVPTFRDGKWSVAWEEASAPVVQHFTPRNSRDFRWSQTYRTLPQGLRCKFVNAEKDYIEDELLCFADGYNKDNAKLYEQAEFPGVTSREIVYKHGLYRHADAKERPAIYTFTVDFEHLVAQRGDRVAMAYDVVQQGLASGRIVAVSNQQLTLDEPAIMEAGKFYGIRVRRRDGTSVVRQVTTNPGVQSVITISGSPPEAGDLYTFGIRDQETGIYRILRIRPGNDLSAEVDLVDDGPNVQNGDSATDIPTGTVTPPPLISTFTPFGLKADSFVRAGENGSVYVVRLYWQPVLGPDYTSFEVVALGDNGTIRQVVDGTEQVAEFLNVQTGIWHFTVRGLMSDGRYTLASSPLAVPVNVPYDDLGIGLDDSKQDVYQTLQELRADQAELRDRLEILAAGTADATGASSEMHTVTRKFRNATAIALREMTASIEAKTQVYRQPTAPAGDLVDGDIWIDTSADNFVRVWNATLGQWEDAGAKGLLTFAQPAAPTASNVGDLWIDTDDDNKLYRWDGTDWVNISDERITAQASILDAVRAQVGEISADGLRKIEVVAGTGDVVARLVDMVRASIGDDWVEAGTIIEVGFTGGDPDKPFSNYILMGERIMFMTATGEVYGLFGSDGLTIQNARLGTLKFDRLESNNDKLVIQGAGASPYISVKV